MVDRMVKLKIQRPIVPICGICGMRLASSAPHGDRGCIKYLLERVEILKAWADKHVDEADNAYSALEARVRKIEDNL